MKTLVTGGLGFIGSHLTRRLLADGARVCVLDNLSSGRGSNLTDVAGDIDLIVGDLRDPDALARAVRGVEIVFHQAAIPSVPLSMADPAATIAVNIDGTLALLLAARDAGARRVVFASSSSVYGDAPERLKAETLPARTLSPYAVSKLAGEQLCAVFTRSWGLETVALRYFNVFGPNQDPHSPYAAVIPRFIAAMLAGTSPTIYGDGEQTRDLAHVDDVVAANLLAASASGLTEGVFNIAGGRAVSVNEIYAIAAALIGHDQPPIYAPPRPGDVRDSLADITRARTQIGYAPAVQFEDGLRRSVVALASTL